MTRIKIAEWDNFYKYGSLTKINRVKSMICENKFYFATPSQLNDPSDCKNTLKDDSEEEIEKQLIEANRKFFGNSRGDSYIKEAIKKGIVADQREQALKILNQIMDTRNGVFSLTKRPDNMALWAKYADDHKGYCLEFSNLSRFSYVYEVIYSEKIPLSLSLEEDPSKAEFLYTKSPEWSNEEEARILAKPPGFHIFPKDALKGIILGEHCDEENEKQIVGWIKECDANILVKKAKFNSVKQKLEFLQSHQVRPYQGSDLGDARPLM